MRTDWSGVGEARAALRSLPHGPAEEGSKRGIRRKPQRGMKAGAGEYVSSSMASTYWRTFSAGNEQVRSYNCLLHLIHSLTFILLFKSRYPPKKSQRLGRGSEESEELVPVFCFFFLLAVLFAWTNSLLLLVFVKKMKIASISYLRKLVKGDKLIIFSVRKF